jgi:acetyl-CoA C-acetyltransferase
MIGGEHLKMQRTVLVGAGQVRRRPELDGPWEPLEPLELMAEAAGRAAKDAGSGDLVREVDLIGTIDPIAWSYADLPMSLATRVGASPRATAEVLFGGNSPCRLLNDVANRVAEGEVHLALLAGAETMYSRFRARKEGVELDWTPIPEGARDMFRGQRPMANDLERRHGLLLPVQTYPLFENALRAEAGRSIEEHQRVVSGIMARYADVAARNPFAWFPESRTAEEIRTISDQNRWVYFPYPKRMNAIMGVDQSAALILMSESEADRRGIPEGRRVYFLGGASATDAWCPTERIDFVSSPAYRRASRSALGEAAVDLGEIDRFDLYSCFPSVIEFALKELGLELDEPRPLTVTGGLSYAGGPGNNYSMHSIANMMGCIQRGEARIGYVSALGFTATKHAISVLSDRARDATGRARVVELPEEETTGPPLVDAPEGPGRIETYTVEFDRENRPKRSMVVVRLDDGRRTLAHGEETAEAFAGLVEREGVGTPGRVIPGEGDDPNRFVTT